MFFLFLLVLLFNFSVYAENVPVSTIKVYKEKIYKYYKANGVFKSDRSLYIKPEVSGKIVDITVKEGDFVKEGDLLAVIETKKYDYQILSQEYVVKKLESIYRYKKNLFEKKKVLFKKGLISEDEFKFAELDMKTAFADLNSAREKLKEFLRQKNETEVKAPFDCVVDKKFVSVGDFVNSSTKLFYLVDLKKLLFNFKLPQRFIKSLHLGDTVDIYIEGIGKLEGRIVYISSSLTENSLITYKAKVEIKDFLKENMFAVVKLVEKVFEGFKLPERAVHMEKDGNFVYVVEQGKIRKKRIVILTQDYGYIFVDGNLKNGDMVVVSAPFGLKEGVHVYVEN